MVKNKGNNLKQPIRNLVETYFIEDLSFSHMSHIPVKFEPKINRQT